MSTERGKYPPPPKKPKPSSICSRNKNVRLKDGRELTIYLKNIVNFEGLPTLSANNGQEGGEIYIFVIFLILKIKRTKIPQSKK